MPKRSHLVDAQKLLVLRRAKAWSQERLAEQAQCDPKTVVKAESGGPLDLRTISSLAEALGVEPQELMRSDLPSGQTVSGLPAPQQRAEPSSEAPSAETNGGHKDITFAFSRDAQIRPHPKRVGWAIAVLCFVVAGAIAFGILQTRKSKDVEEAHIIEGQVVSLAVLPYENESADRRLNWLGQALAETLRFEFGQPEHLRDIPKSRLQQVARDLQVSLDPSHVRSSLPQVAKATHADSVIAGSYRPMSDGYIQITSAILSLRPYRYVEITTEVTSEKDLPRAIDKLARQVRKELMLPEQVLQEEDRHPRHVSILAVHAYDEGKELAAAGNNRDSIQKFEQAMSYDNGFAFAYSAMAESYAAIGSYRQAEQASQRAIELTQGYSADEVYSIRAVHSRITNENAKLLASGILPVQTGGGIELLDYLFWFVSPALQIGILLALYRRRLIGTYPFFACYTLIAILSEPILLKIHSSYSYLVYYYAFYIHLFVWVALSILVLNEIVGIVLRRIPLLRRRPMLLLGILLLLVIAGGMIVSLLDHHKIIGLWPFADSIFFVERGLLLLQFSLVIVLLFFRRRLHTKPQETVFGVALGFGVFAGVNTTVAKLMESHLYGAAVLSQINSGAYALACSIWLLYALGIPARVRKKEQVSLEFAGWPSRTESKI